MSEIKATENFYDYGIGLHMGMHISNNILLT